MAGIALTLTSPGRAIRIGPSATPFAMTLFPALVGPPGGGGGGGAVASVNGQTGVVVLDAADVGADPAGAASAAAVASVPAAALGVSVAQLVGGVVPTAQIPAVAITEFIGTAASQAAMLALTGQKGDWAIRSDTGVTWVITGNDPTQLADWTPLSYPGAPVTTVNGQAGVVVLGAADVGADVSGAAAAAQATAIAAAAADATSKANAAQSAAIAASAPVGAAVVHVQAFTASGTWTKPAGVSIVHVVCIGGGGGGGSGRKGAAGTIRCSGGGGGGGGRSEKCYPPFRFPAQWRSLLARAGPVALRARRTTPAARRARLAALRSSTRSYARTAAAAAEPARRFQVRPAAAALDCFRQADLAAPPALPAVTLALAAW